MTLSSLLGIPKASPPDMDLEPLQLAVGRMESRWARQATVARLSDAEFKVFSQWGEDGIIQYLLGRVPAPNRFFVEFGVQDYSESNTRFLLCNDSWRGVIFDGGTSHLALVAQRGYDWRYGLDAVSAFITRENVNEVLVRAGARGDIGLVSIDIDGNDYWVLEALDVVTPRLLIVEYNSVFGPSREVTIPYDPSFTRSRAHYSHLYYGASLGALHRAAGRKGYAFVGSNGAGNNAFFVRRDVLGSLRELTAAEGWVESRFRESRGPSAELTLLTTHGERLRAIGHLPVVDVASGRTASISQVFELGGGLG